MEFLTDHLIEVEKEFSSIKVTLIPDPKAPNSLELRINDFFSGLSDYKQIDLNSKPWNLLSNLDIEISRNISLPVSSVNKKDYLKMLINRLKSIEEKIIQVGTLYTSDNLYYENCSKNDFKDYKLNHLSNYLKALIWAHKTNILFIFNKLQGIKNSHFLTFCNPLIF